MLQIDPTSYDEGCNDGDSNGEGCNDMDDKGDDDVTDYNDGDGRQNYEYELVGVMR